MSRVATRQWTVAREALRETAPRFAKLLRTVRNPGAQAVGDWSIAETAAHVSVAARFDTGSALQEEPPPEWADLVELALGAGELGDVAKLNELSLEREGERDLDVLGQTTEEQCAHLLEATTGADGSEAVTWLGGVQLTLAGVVAHLVSEMLVHGFDIARAERRAWAIPPEPAVLFHQAFFVPLLRELGDGFISDDARRVGDVSCRLEAWGADPVLIVWEGGRLSIEDPDGRIPDVRISGDPGTMALVMYERIGPVGPLLRGRLRVGGRRPWRLRRFKRVLQTP